ncbi:MAG: type IX secretion system membrane protein PorP/SprF [Saprospiraceae bacterium]
MHDLLLKRFSTKKFWIERDLPAQSRRRNRSATDITPAINLAYAYDLTLNDLKEASSGSHEITVGLKFGHPKDRRRWRCR